MILFLYAASAIVAQTPQLVAIQERYRKITDITFDYEGEQGELVFDQLSTTKPIRQLSGTVQYHSSGKLRVDHQVPRPKDALLVTD